MRVNDASQKLSRSLGQTWRAALGGRQFSRFIQTSSSVLVSGENDNKVISLTANGNGAGGFAPLPANGNGAGGFAPPPMPTPAPAPPPPTASPNMISSGVAFSSLTNVSAATQRAIREVLGYQYMTPVQAQTLPVCLSGGDVIAKAKTGTGKTMGFLLPSIERVVAAGHAPGRAIHVLVMSPTRELAMQIAKECEKLVTFQGGISVQSVIGGTNMRSEQKRMAQRPPTVLVATPGRLQDHLNNTPNCAQMLSGIHTLVFDECDQLVDQGFWPAISKILNFLPSPAARQTLLFSATMGKRVIDAGKQTMRPGFQVVDTVGEEVSTADAVAQSAMVVPLDFLNAALVAAVQRARSVPSHKIIVFFTTARQTQWAAELFAAMGMPVHEIHSRKSQTARERVSKQFKNETNTVMFSSDVSARGMDYPDVTQVIQVGAPMSKEQYIHRLGRTARAGKSGEGMLLLTPHEDSFLRTIRDLPVKHLQFERDDNVAMAAAEGARLVDPKTGALCYQAFLGYYNSCSFAKMRKPQLVQMANQWAACMGLPGPPRLEKKTVGKMGLKGVAGLNV